MNTDMKVQRNGMIAVGIILAAAGIVIAFFLKDMVDNTMMGASDRYRPHYPEIPVTDITKAPQCAEGYDKTWVGCQRLGQ